MNRSLRDLDPNDSTQALIWHQQHFELSSTRTIYWPKHKLLFCSDLHIGKTECFRAHGIPLPDGAMTKDLQRLAIALNHYQPQRLLILGDLIHSPLGLTENVIKSFEEFRASFSNISFSLIEGNHDRHIRQIPPSWNLDLLGHQAEVDNIVFSHEPIQHRLNWSGHIHPMARILSGRLRLRLPCFFVGEKQAYLPAFSGFTRGLNVKKSKTSDRIIAIAKNSLIEI